MFDFFSLRSSRAAASTSTRTIGAARTLRVVFHAVFHHMGLVSRASDEHLRRVQLLHKKRGSQVSSELALPEEKYMSSNIPHRATKLVRD